MFMMRTPYISDAHTSKPTLLRKLVHFKGECRDTLSEEYKSHSCKKRNLMCPVHGRLGGGAAVLDNCYYL